MSNVRIRWYQAGGGWIREVAGHVERYVKEVEADALKIGSVYDEREINHFC